MLKAFILMAALSPSDYDVATSEPTLETFVSRAECDHYAQRFNGLGYPMYLWCFEPINEERADVEAQLVYLYGQRLAWEALGK